MTFTTPIEIARPSFVVEPLSEMLFVGSCFANEVGQMFADDHFRATINPYGTMYNPASVLHTIEKWTDGVKERDGQTAFPPQKEGTLTAFITLGTNHVYIEKATGEIVDNCQKRPQKLFTEKELSIDECAEYLTKAIERLRAEWPKVNVVMTVSPIRYRKYGYHESQLSKATLLLAIDKVCKGTENTAYYFPSYEIVLDELRDYRFYKNDMLHPSDLAVSYIYDRLKETMFSSAALSFVKEWQPLRRILAHRPSDAESEEYRQLIAATNDKIEKLIAKTHKENSRT